MNGLGLLREYLLGPAKRLRRRRSLEKKLVRLAKRAGVPIEAVELYLESYGYAEAVKALKALAVLKA